MACSATLPAGPLPLNKWNKNGKGLLPILVSPRFPPEWEASDVEGTGFCSLFPIFPPHTLVTQKQIFSREHSGKRRLLLAFAPFLARPREVFAILARVPRHGARIGKSLMIDPL
jgi:hypothetical protein